MTTTVLAYISSPSQGVWHVFGVPLRAYALFIIVGIISALVIGDRRWVARGGEPGVIYDIALWAVPFGLLGGRLYHVITDWRTYFGDDGAGFVGALRIWDGGLGIWGAVALGGVGAWIACRRRGIPLPAFGDAVAPGIVLAQAIGRLGNYFNQELFGRETTVPWGLEIYERTNAAGAADMLNGVSTGQLLYVVHPTFLYELLWNLLVFAALILIDRRFRIGHGRLFAMYVAGYCLGRFWIELLRSDTATLLAGIRINSFTATFVFIGAVVYIMAAPKGREDPATLRGDQDVDEDSEVDEFAKKLTSVGATTGVVAAAKAAGEDEKSVAEAAEADVDVDDLDAAGVDEPEPVEDEGVPDTAGLGSVETNELAASVEGATEARDATVKADALVAESEVEDAAEVREPAVDGEAEAESLADGVEAEEPEADVSLVAESEVADSEEAEADVVPEASSGGLGSVEGDEMAEAVQGASDAHESAVKGGADAESLSAEVAAEDVEAEDGLTAAESEGGLGSVEGDEVAESVEGAADAHESAVEGEADAEALVVEVDAEDVAAEPEADALVDESAVEDSVAVSGTGVGSVEGDELAESFEGAADAHESAVEGEADAEALVAEVDVEDVAAEPAADSLVDESEVEDFEADEAETVSDVGGVGSVGGDEVAESVEGVPETHEPAVEGEAGAEVLAAEVDAEGSEADEVEPVSGVGGVGLVEGDELAESFEDAADVHESAVEGEAGAEVLAAEVDAEGSEADEVEPVSDVGGVGLVEGDEVAESVEGALDAHESAVEGEAGAEVLAAEVAAENSEADEAEAVSDAGGVGSVKDDEVAESVDDAPDVHESAVEGEADAEALVAEVDANESEADEPEEVPDVGGVDSVEGDEVADSVDGASDVHESAVEGEADAEALVADAEAGEPSTDDAEADSNAGDRDSEASDGPDAGSAAAKETPVTQTPSYRTSFESGGRVRRWLRRRRSR